MLENSRTDTSISDGELELDRRLLAFANGLIPSKLRLAIGQNIEPVVPDPCRADTRVSVLDAKACGVFALVFAMSKVDRILEAYPAAVPSGHCAASRRAF